MKKPPKAAGKEVKEMAKMYRNALRRWIVKKLLGRRLIVERKDTPSGPEWQLVDMKRRIPYGWVRVVAVNDRDFKIVMYFD